MKVHVIKDVPFEFDETIEYYDFFIEANQPRLVSVDFDVMLGDFALGQRNVVDFREMFILLDRWLRDVPRKKFYRNMVKNGAVVCSNEYWFDDLPDEQAEEIFTRLENSGKLARRFLEVFLPEVAEQCQKDHHPAEKYYIDP
jgi:hypothetical protein